MPRFSSVYLTGPDPWGPDAERLVARSRRLIEARGLAFIGAKASRGYPAADSEADARRIYTEVLADVRAADVVIANLTPWRGVSAHPEAAFVLGFAAGLGTPAFGYINVVDETEAELASRIDRLLGTELGSDGVIRDAEGARIETFGLPETLIVWAQTRRLFIIVTPEPLNDNSGLELCLDALKLYED